MLGGMGHVLLAFLSLALTVQLASARLVGLRIEDLGSYVMDPQSTLLMVEEGPLDTELDVTDGFTDGFLQPYPFSTIDQSWHSWVDQQLALMEMLDNMVMTGCPMQQRMQWEMPLTLQTSTPGFLTQMTISRGLRPQIYSKVFEYPGDLSFIHEDLSTQDDDDVDSFSTVSVFGDDTRVSMEDGDDDAPNSSEAAAFLAALTPRELAAALVDEEDPAQDQIYGSTDAASGSFDDADFQSAQWTSYNQLASEGFSGGDDVDWGFITSDGELNWGLILFTGLCLGCGAVWFSLVRSWHAIGRSCCGPRKGGAKQFMTADDFKQPLLDELEQEDKLAPEIAASHAGADSVPCLSYEPLKFVERPAYHLP